MKKRKFIVLLLGLFVFSFGRTSENEIEKPDDFVVAVIFGAHDYITGQHIFSLLASKDYWIVKRFHKGGGFKMLRSEFESVKRVLIEDAEYLGYPIIIDGKFYFQEWKPITLLQNITIENAQEELSFDKNIAALLASDWIESEQKRGYSRIEKLEVVFRPYLNTKGDRLVPDIGLIIKIQLLNENTENIIELYGQVLTFITGETVAYPLSTSGFKMPSGYGKSHFAW